MYADWWYLWALSYFANMHAYILIVLKKSLKWMAVLGWVCISYLYDIMDHVI
jgi:hypothetical protein